MATPERRHPHSIRRVNNYQEALIADLLYALRAFCDWLER
jgi:hypothetical protein